MGFLLGLIIGMILSPILLVIISKPLMKWIVKRQATKLMTNVAGKLSGIQDQIQITKKNGYKKENSKIDKDRSSKGASSPIS